MISHTAVLQKRIAAITLEFSHMVSGTRTQGRLYPKPALRNFNGIDRELKTPRESNLGLPASLLGNSWCVFYSFPSHSFRHVHDLLAKSIARLILFLVKLLPIAGISYICSFFPCSCCAGVSRLS